MRKRLTVAAVAAGAAGIAAALAVGSAGAAPQTATLGSVSGTPSQNIASCASMITCTFVPFNGVADPELVVPFDGTVTSFSVNGNSGKVELRVLRPAGSGKYTGERTSPAKTLTTPGVNTFTVSLPVKQGDVLGLDNDSSAILFDTSSSAPLTAYYELPSLADGATLAPNHTQPGYRLLLSAVVRASGTGTNGTTTTTTTTTPPGAPQLTNLKQSHRRWREGKKLARFASGGQPPVGTTFRFSVNQSVRLKFAFKQQRCGHRCAHGTLSYPAAAGTHKLSFQGRISKKKRLPTGRYKLTLTATNAAGMHSAASMLSFKIVAG